MPESILKASCTSARHAGSFDCLMARLILITVDNGRGHCAWWQSCTVPNQTHRGNNKKRKMYAIKQIKICAEYRDMIPRPRLDLSGTPGLGPIGLSPGSWQTSLGLGSMSRYSAQILICIPKVQNTLVTVPIVSGGGARLALTFKAKCHLKVKFYPVLSFKFVRVITAPPFNLGSTNLDQRCKTTWLRSLLFWGEAIARLLHSPDCFTVSTLGMYTDLDIQG